MQDHKREKFQRSCFNGVRKKDYFFFFLNELCQLFSLDMCGKKVVYYDLLDEINDCTQLQLNRIKPWYFQFKPFDIVVTLNYSQGHCKWYKWAKLSEYYRHANFDIYHIYGVRETATLKILRHTDTRPAGLTMNIT